MQPAFGKLAALVLLLAAVAAHAKPATRFETHLFLEKIKNSLLIHRKITAFGK